MVDLPQVIFLFCQKSDRGAPDWTPTKTDFEKVYFCGNEVKYQLNWVKQLKVYFFNSLFFLQDGARIAPDEVVE